MKNLSSVDDLQVRLPNTIELFDSIIEINRILIPYLPSLKLSLLVQYQLNRGSIITVLTWKWMNHTIPDIEMIVPTKEALATTRAFLKAGVYVFTVDITKEVFANPENCLIPCVTTIEEGLELHKLEIVEKITEIMYS